MAKYEVLIDCDFDEIIKSSHKKVGDIIETYREDAYLKVLLRNNIIKKIEE
jgi:hypothetical protein